MPPPRGRLRLRACFDRWFRRVSVEIDSGCIYISGAVEFDDRPGPVRDALVARAQTWQRALERAIRIAREESNQRAHRRAGPDAAPKAQRVASLIHFRSVFMPHYTPPLRDMQFVMHEVLNVVDELKALPPYAEIDVDTINAIVAE